ncbi:cisplatin damage response ATP-dependent DNA ligase [Bradyrhizobium sp. 180]|uniref:cisplatin damage response ATP-dependent DNA ligase n=1 Tax=unclassified Bradyrhizobium TaxID=2631580 RepID=UPI001FFA9981|nr:MULTISPECIES: cisplatin damage response ATP-dependent DNA ligase [unclassified Bradyrhizobium]MCK1425463.1 cisplatin damage response ATP-dependent DNA ligase [Bradyrhizobium sp. CW12]MCK1493913.1 cisplatin damage response ATP-dependent DNA ligase [Bradyrhizobium sp. 180]MCK1532020.1 cisplatin damage response ATP-dependent DNA ligase [Bradyrhizobium sp. 182]MCK1595245.1 cisplatin damage response ATP-dependent DNA ligase [Bradyrhizobium sp. 164]MCK1644532.1 cisplatin damage response ATP-depen
MNRFAELLDRLAYEPGRNNKLRLITGYFREVGDPDRGYALAALTGALSFKHAKPALIRDLIAARTDPVLFGLSYDYVGDLSETVALMWPKQAHGNNESFPGYPSPQPSPTSAFALRASTDERGEGAQRSTAQSPDASVTIAKQSKREGHTSLTVPSPLVGEGQEGGYRGRDTNVSSHPSNHNSPPPPSLTEVVTTLRTLGKTELPRQLERWLDELDETGRWALLKLVTGGLRIGISARLAKTAVAALGDKDPHEIELIWPGLAPPYLDLFAWLEGRAEKPVNRDPAPFRPVMLAHAIEDMDFAALDPADYIAEWKWDGIRVQAVAGRDDRGHITARLYSRTGEDITGSFPDLVPALRLPGAIDGELLILREGRVQSFNVLQQRLNRKVVSPKLIKEFPIHLRAYDLLGDDENDLRELPFAERRERLETFIAKLDDPRIDLSPTIPFASWEALTAARADPASAGAGEDADAVEGVMLKRRDAPYMPGRPKGQWWKWKRDPHIIDAVLMYAQRGHGKRSSYYSDYTFGVWTAGDGGDELVPVGKAYFGFTDEELLQIDRFVRRNTTEKFGPVRHVVHEPDKGLVLEVAFEGLQRSPRHKSGVAMRFPRISRLRWDKPPREADRLETLERMLKAEAAEIEA